MSQVIEVRFIGGEVNTILSDEFTKASSHREAIELALGIWSGGVGVLTDMEREGEGEFIPVGGASCWRYTYRCTLENEYTVLAVLFAQYKEKRLADLGLSIV